jgi:1-acyl-sn-glycerol-3-phosphate acyltransferase
MISSPASGARIHGAGRRRAPAPTGGSPERDGAAFSWSALGSALVEPGLDASDPGNRDPAFIRRVVPFLDAITTPYFRPEFEGIEHLPARGPFIAVANHNGGPMLADLWALFAFWVRTRGTDIPVYVMVHDFAFQVRIAGNFFLRLGGLRASLENAEKVLAMGGGLLVYPGGELDCFRSFWQRNRVNLQGRTGFARLALEHGVPIVPIVNVGGHEVYCTLSSGRGLARWSGLERLTRVKALPLTLGLPWGLWLTGFVPFLPLPAKFVYRVGEPVRVRRDPERAGDPDAVRRIYRQVMGAMQDMVDDIAARRRFPVLG